MDTMDPTVALPYLVHTVAYNNSKGVSLYQNLKKAQRQWGMVAKLMTKAGVVVRLQSMIYKAVFQTVLLYGSDVWVVTGAILTVLEGFHHRLARQITVNITRRSGCGRWEWSSVEEALEVKGMWIIKEYIQMQNSKIAVHFSNRPLYEICTGAENFPGSSIFMR